MNGINTVVLLSSFFATINLAEQASFNVNVLRQLSKRHAKDFSISSTSGNATSNITTRLSETKSHKQRSASLEKQCGTKNYRKTISPRGDCQVQVQIGMCYGDCASYTVPGDNRNPFRTHCKCCRPAKSQTAVFKVDCNLNPPTARRHTHNSVQLGHKQYLVSVQEATSCSCRPIRCQVQ